MRRYELRVVSYHVRRVLKRRTALSTFQPNVSPCSGFDMYNPHHSHCGCSQDGCTDRAVDRRQFVKLAGVGVAAASGVTLPTMAGPFEANEYLETIPLEKKLDAAWIQSLFARGEKETYADASALRHIGMPVGGLFAGTVYLSGDGQLWLWDVFNRDQTGVLPREATLPDGIGVGGNNNMRGLNYLQPAPLTQPFEIGFKIAIGDAETSLSATDFEEVTFDGRYPIGRVTYRDSRTPVQVALEAFSPFIPLNLDDSSLPATVMSFRLKNRGDEPLKLELRGTLENPICLETKANLDGRLRNRVLREVGYAAIECGAEAAPPQAAEAGRPDILFDDFERADHGDWRIEGEAFGAGPVLRSEIPEYQGDVGGQGNRVVNSHAAAPGGGIPEKDGHVGVMTSKPFTVARRFIQFYVGGGAHQGRTCVNLLVDGKVVASATGREANHMQQSLSRYANLGGKAGNAANRRFPSRPLGKRGRRRDHVYGSAARQRSDRPATRLRNDDARCAGIAG